MTGRPEDQPPQQFECPDASDTVPCEGTAVKCLGPPPWAPEDAVWRCGRHAGLILPGDPFPR